MAVALTEIRKAIAANIQAAPCGAAFSQILHAPVGSPTTPCAWVIRADTQFDFTLQDDSDEGVDELTFIVQVFVSLGDDLESIDLLDQFASKGGPMSIKKAIETIDSPPNITLGGLVDDLRVTMIGRDQIMRLPGLAVEAIFLGHDYTVQVYASGAGYVS